MERATEPDAMRLLEAVGYLHLRVSIGVNRDMAQTGLSVARYRLLRFIEARAPTTAREIREFFGFSPRTVTEAVDGLERDGFVRRTRSDVDRRVIAITIEPSGVAALRASDAPLVKAADRVFGSLSGGERRDLLRLLDRVLEGL